MSTQKVPLEALQKIRQHLKIALALPESENHPQARSLDLAEPDSLAGLGDLFRVGDTPDLTAHMPNLGGKWFISAANPGAALIKLPGLKLKPGIRLVSYLYRFQEEGLSVTWALPEPLSTTALLEAALKTCDGLENPPAPAGRLANFMEAVIGDRSPMSFVIASVLRRELKEFGALGAARNWSNHRLIDALPAQVQWQWRTEAVKDLSPKIRLLPDGKAALEFFTCCTVPSIAVFQHLDHYAAGQYQAQGLDRAVAIAQKLVRA